MDASSFQRLQCLSLGLPANGTGGEKRLLNCITRTSLPSQGNAIVEGAFIQVGGVDFVPQETIIKDWSDWGLVVRLQDGEQAIDATLGHGIPFTYFETEGMKPKITFSLPVTFLDASQEEVRFPVKTNQLLITLGEKLFGLHFPDDTTIDGDQAGQIDSKFFSISVLPDAAALESFHAYALNIPRSTEVLGSGSGEFHAAKQVDRKDRAPQWGYRRCRFTGLLVASRQRLARSRF